MGKLALALLFSACCALAVAGPLPDGAPAPNNLGKTLTGQPVTVASLHGKVVVISFWATWCEYCMEEMPVLGGLQATATREHLPLQIVAVNFEQPHSVFARATHLLMPKLPGLLLTRDRNGQLAHAYGVGKALPAMILLNRDGTIAETDIGYDKSALKPLLAEINHLLNEPAPQAAVTSAPIAVR